MSVIFSSDSSGSIQTSDSCSSESATPRSQHYYSCVVAQRKRLPNKTKFYKLLPKVPRILKADERRNYGFFFINALNSGDWPAIYNCFSTFCSPSFSSSYSARLPGVAMPVPKTLILRNVQETCEFIYLRSLLSPDNTWRPLKNIQLRVSSTGRAILEFDMELVFTFMYEGDIVQKVLGTPSSVLFPETATHTGPEAAACNANAKFALIQKHLLDEHEQGLVTFSPTRRQNKVVVHSRIHIDPSFEVNHIEYIYTLAVAN